ncbi:Putative hemolysin [Thioclava dalianensis]|uniref:GNAT family N-acetyltransferase n=1 Tax=Thioclava dalianensis TaxID=1185766 RepID=UPI00056E542D|nr:GNAT family N-acetyltransferase [Thioclava dalianensis]SFN57520.1 Putative hemolysin [Thioclava dalianensis]
MDLSISKGNYRVRQAQGAADLDAVLRLRAQSFRAGRSDLDAFDSQARHVLVEETDGTLLAGFRLNLLDDDRALSQCYCAQSYDLAPLMGRAGPHLELGRFCTRPGLRDPDVLRLGWAAITRLAERHGVRLLFGASSFHGAQWRDHAGAFAHLAAHALGPDGLRPRPRAPETVTLVQAAAEAAPMPDAQPASLPPLLRSYLGMGGWTSDHAVIDRDLDTCHVFTALDPTRIPPARLKALRALAG